MLNIRELVCNNGLALLLFEFEFIMLQQYFFLVNGEYVGELPILHIK